jgi:uncharacterized membrane protein
MRTAVAFLTVLAILIGLDFVWLSLSTETIYRPMMGDLLRREPNLVPGAGFYALFALALTMLVLLPALTEGRVRHDALSWRAALLGLTCFATYDLTALAVIEGWSLPLSLIDMTWGTFAAVASTNLAAVIHTIRRRSS